MQEQRAYVCENTQQLALHFALHPLKESTRALNALLKGVVE